MLKVIGVARLTRDPQLSYLPNQTPVCKFGVATSRKYGDKEKTCYLDCIAWGKTADSIQKWFTKGKPIVIDGELELDTWEDKDSGGKRSRHVLNVRGFEFVPSDSTSQGGAERESSGPPPADNNYPSSPPDSDIPF